MTTCRYCAQPIVWSRTASGWRPINPDRSRHLCRAAGSTKVNHIVAPVIRGERYMPCCGQCGSPPWEFCGCSERAEPRTESAA